MRQDDVRHLNNSHCQPAS